MECEHDIRMILHKSGMYFIERCQMCGMDKADSVLASIDTVKGKIANSIVAVIKNGEGHLALTPEDIETIKKVGS